LIHILAEKVHVALALGRPQPEAIEEAESLAIRAELRPESYMALNLSRAQRAQAAFEAGGTHSSAAKRVEDIPDGVRQWPESIQAMLEAQGRSEQ
jgi:hypothetical protein